jgi:hypothetical protein
LIRDDGSGVAYTVEGGEEPLMYTGPGPGDTGTPDQDPDYYEVNLSMDAPNELNTAPVNPVGPGPEEPLGPAGTGQPGGGGEADQYDRD